MIQLLDPQSIPAQGNFTLPTEAGQEALVQELAARWGADALRDSDGTELSADLTAMGYDIFSTVCLTRADQAYVTAHPEFLIRKFLRSDPVTARSHELLLTPMSGFDSRKYRIDLLNDPQQYWEVHNRSTGEKVPNSHWSFDPLAGTVMVHGITPWHQYTVNFLVQQIWDSTSMHNHLTNHWTCAPIMSVDPAHPDCYAHLMRWFDHWLATHPLTDVVRLTTLCYHFPIDAAADGHTRYFDGQGYADTVSIPLLESFEKRFGYRMTSEDFVDSGYYHNSHRVPTRQSRDWMAHVHEFIVGLARDLTDKIHAAGKKAAIFWGDHWIGTEMYLPSAQEMGIDIHINACEGGVVTRRCAEAPGNQTKELRLYPYLFPDTFNFTGGQPLRDSQLFWVNVRRGLLRAPVDRIGYGGYLSLAAQFPEFVDQVAGLAQEFRALITLTGKARSRRIPVKVGILNAWGSARSWIPYEGRDQKFPIPYSENPFLLARSYMLECLAGLPVDVQFLSFDEIIAHGIPNDIQVLINDGDAGTAQSGGHYWVHPEVVAAVRRFVHQGGGFIGVREPSAHAAHGRVFQLADVLGVDLETGESVSQRPIADWQANADHFILADPLLQPMFGSDQTYVAPIKPDTQVLATGPGGHVLAAARDCGMGRAVYFAGLPATPDNYALLLRSLVWAAHREEALATWHSTNPRTEMAWYPEVNRGIVVNNSAQCENTVILDGDGHPFELNLPAFGYHWFTA